MRIFRPAQSLEELAPESIFLAGPTPREPEVRSWRPEAVDILERLGFTGDVLIPEPFCDDFERQVAWEKEGLDSAAAIVFWVPRDLDTLPGFTTNVEFGRYVDSGRSAYGRPEGAPKTKYLDWIYRDATGREPDESMKRTLATAVAMATPLER